MHDPTNSSSRSSQNRPVTSHYTAQPQRISIPPVKLATPFARSPSGPQPVLHAKPPSFMQHQRTFSDAGPSKPGNRVVSERVRRLEQQEVRSPAKPVHHGMTSKGPSSNVPGRANQPRGSAPFSSLSDAMMAFKTGQSFPKDRSSLPSPRPQPAMFRPIRPTQTEFRPKSQDDSQGSSRDRSGSVLSQASGEVAIRSPSKLVDAPQNPQSRDAPKKSHLLPSSRSQSQRSSSPIGHSSEVVVDISPPSSPGFIALDVFPGPSRSFGSATPQSAYSASLMSPQSDRSGPADSPDPLNLISPAGRFPSRNRQVSPTLDRGASMSSRARSLSQAMGSSMSASLTPSPKRKREETPQPAKKQMRSGPSPIKATTFYAQSKPKTLSKLSQKEMLPIKKVPARVVKSSAKAIAQQKDAKKPVARAKKEETPPSSADSPDEASSDLESEESYQVSSSSLPSIQSSPQRLNRRPQRKQQGTVFTSSLALALPADSNSDSEEEWDKDDLYATATPYRMQREPSVAAATPKTELLPPPVSLPSGGAIKDADRRPPIRRLLDLLEDLFEADSTLPDPEALIADETEELSSQASSYFVLIDRCPVLKPTRLQQIGRLVRTCSLHRHVILASTESNRDIANPGQTPADPTGSPAKQEPRTVADIDAADIQRLLRILGATVKVGEGIDPFRLQGADDVYGSAKMDVKPARGRRARSRSKTPRPAAQKGLDSDGEIEEDEDVGDDIEAAEKDESERDSTASPRKSKSPQKDKSQPGASPLPSKPAIASEEQVTLDKRRQMGEQLSRIATSAMGVDCCMSILCSEGVDGGSMSEDIVRPCFDMMRSTLEQVVFPFVEACANIGSSTVHPLLEAWVRALAPDKGKAKRGRKPKQAQEASAEQPDETLDPAGIFAGCADYLASIFHTSCSAMTLAQKLVQSPKMSLSETIIFSAVYAGIGPFFVVEPDAAGGHSENAKLQARGRIAMQVLSHGLGQQGMAMKSLRMPALDLLRNIFARHPEQRQWIIEEVMASLTKLPDIKKSRRQFNLRNGKSIHAITALLLQLVQTAADSIERSSTASEANIVGDSGAVGTLDVGLAASERANDKEEGDSQMDDVSKANEIETAQYDLGSLRRALDGPGLASRSIANYIMGKIAPTKVTKSSGDFSYAAVLENLVTDLLATVFLPEWPSASLLLTAVCRSFGNVLEENKSTPDAKGVALEHLGNISAHMRQSQSRVEALEQVSGQLVPISKLQVLEDKKDTEGLLGYNDNYRTLLNHLAAADVDDSASKSSRDFVLSQWASELSACLVRVSTALEIAKGAEDAESRQEAPQIEAFLAAVHRSLLEVSKQTEKLAFPSTNVFDVRPLESYDVVARVAEQVVHSTSFVVNFELPRTLLLEALDSPAVGNRTKALRGLAAIYAVDSSLLSDCPPVREAIETRLSDESVGVREAALSLLSKHLLEQPGDHESLYQTLCERIFDAGLAVRKRTLKLLASIYRKLPSEAMKLDACVRMVRCVNDEDTGIQALAVQTLGELWFDIDASDLSNDKDLKLAASTEGEDAPLDAVQASVEGEQALPRSIHTDMSIIVNVAGQIRERPSPLEEVFRRFRRDQSEEGLKKMLEKMQTLNDALIVALDDEAGESYGSTLAKIRTIHLLVSTNPAVLSISKAKALLPHVKGGVQTSDEAVTLETLLKIFRASIPMMPRTALAFASQLENTIRPMLNNPPRHMTVLQEIIACYTTVVRSHTHNFSILIRTISVLLQALRGVSGRLLEQPDAPMDRRARVVMSETALLCEMADLDVLVKEFPEAKQEIKTHLGDESIKDDVFNLLLDIRKSPTHRSAALQDIGFLFRGFPLLMVEDLGMAVMDEVFASPNSTEKELLLRIILDFLTTDSAKRSPEQVAAQQEAAARGRPATARSTPKGKRVNMAELVGNTDNFADSGVSSALVQRYLDSILDAVVSIRQPNLQRPAMDILKFIVQQGLSHPLQCVPTLIALETCDERFLSVRALQLHEHLASKHTTILASRYKEPIKSSFEFQYDYRAENLQDLRGYRIDAVSGTSQALLHSWYGLVKEKRQSRLDLVKALTKLMDIDVSNFAACDQKQVLLSRYVADNLATLDYKTIEEVLQVIFELKQILSVSGAQIKFVAEEYVSNAESGSEEPWSDHAYGGSLKRSHARKRYNDGDSEDDEDEEMSQQEDSSSDEDDGSRTQRGPIVAAKASMIGSSPAPYSNGDDVDTEPEEVVLVGLDRALASARMSIVMGTVLLLRNHLKQLYGLSEERCNKFAPSGGAGASGTTGRRGRKSAVPGLDRPPVRKDVLSSSTLSFDAMPMALDVIATMPLALQQMAAYEDLMDAEGMRGEDPDDWEE